MSVRRLRGAVAGFLGTYVSRNSAHDGYWLFGLLVAPARPLEIELLQDSDTDASALGTAVRLARDRFREQLRRARVVPAAIASAVVRLEPSATMGHASRAGVVSEVPGLRVKVVVITGSGRRIAREAIVFAAPHDPSLESASTSSHRARAARS